MPRDVLSVIQFATVTLGATALWCGALALLMVLEGI